MWCYVLLVVDVLLCVGVGCCYVLLSVVLCGVVLFCCCVVVVGWHVLICV